MDAIESQNQYLNEYVLAESGSILLARCCSNLWFAHHFYLLNLYAAKFATSICDNVSFVIHLDRLEDKRDVLSDDMGSWKNNGVDTTQFVFRSLSRRSSQSEKCDVDDPQWFYCILNKVSVSNAQTAGWIELSYPEEECTAIAYGADDSSETDTVCKIVSCLNWANLRLSQI